MKSENTGARSTKTLNAVLGSLDFILMALGGLFEFEGWSNLNSKTLVWPLSGG